MKLIWWYQFKNQKVYFKVTCHTPQTPITTTQMFYFDLSTFLIVKFKELKIFALVINVKYAAI